MRRVLLAIAALAASAFVAPSAHATAPDIAHGGCGYDMQTVTTDNLWVGVMYDVSVTTTGTTPPLPIGAIVTCWFEINGAVVPGTTHSYGDVPGVAGVQVGSDPVSFVAGPDDFVDECQSITFADNTTWNAGVDPCPADARPQIPPQPILDVILAVEAAAHDAVCGDPGLCGVLCPVLAELAGHYGPVAIEPDGDVDTLDPGGLDTNPVFDCP